jgi:hypothetical protein
MSQELGYLLPDHKLSLKGTEKVDDADAYQVEITKPNGDIVMAYYDVKTGYKVKTEESEDGPQGKVTQATYFLDYKDGQGGLKYPQTIKQSGGPMGLMEMKLQRIDINTNISDELFK